MAVNPVLAQDAVTKDTFPLPSQGEVFFLKRGHIDFSLDGPGGTKLKGTGVFFLSSKRIVFLKKGDIQKHSEFSSFEIPLHLVSDAKFQQPIFGANYMRGKVEPNASAETPIQGTSTWRLTFNAGGCGTFLNIFFKLWNSALRKQQPNPGLIEQLRLGSAAAFSDPNDPSTIYVTQPVPMGTGPSPNTVAAQTGIPPPYQVPASPPPGAPVRPGQVYYPPPASQGYHPPPVPQASCPPPAPQAYYPPPMPQAHYPPPSPQAHYPPPSAPPQGSYPPPSQPPLYYPPPAAPQPAYCPPGAPVNYAYAPPPGAQPYPQQPPRA